MSIVDWDDAVDLLSVCGVSPEVLAETDTARLAARLRASPTGNETFLKLRYDHVLRDQVRRKHERLALQRARSWATDRLLVERDEVNWQTIGLAGFDLLFQDSQGRELQVEVKGYGTRRLASVHLQPSQAQRAREAALGTPPDWRLFVLLGAGSKNPNASVHGPSEVVDLLDRGGIQVRT